MKRILKNEKSLGNPLIFNRSKALNYEPILEKAYASVRGWKSKVLSQAGRTVLINSPLSAYPSHQMMRYSLPKKVKENYDKTQRDFWRNKQDPTHTTLVTTSGKHKLAHINEQQHNMLKQETINQKLWF